MTMNSFAKNNYNTKIERCYNDNPLSSQVI